MENFRISLQDEAFRPEAVYYNLIRTEIAGLNHWLENQSAEIAVGMFKTLSRLAHKCGVKSLENEDKYYMHRFAKLNLGYLRNAKK